MAFSCLLLFPLAGHWQSGLRPSRPLTLEDQGYDWSASTSENHKTRAAPFRAEYADSRERLDYTWHVRYSTRRQALQDEIIRKMLRESAAACFANEACMGAGKTHVMNLLDENGLLPLRSFVRIDLDRIRAQLPETRTYMRLNKQTAGLLTQQEAGAIAEVATEEAFKRGLHVWIDSSLKDERWWSGELRRLRRTYPQYKMGIVHVRASWENVVEREARRGRITGRRIPPTLLAHVFHEVPRAAARLQRLVDLYVEVDNDGAQPRLRRPEDVLSFMRLCRQLQPAASGRERPEWRRQQAFVVWRWFDVEAARA